MVNTPLGVARGSYGPCMLVVLLWINTAFGQSSETPVAQTPESTACTPACAEGFECTQGFCLAAGSQQTSAPASSITVPGLALGAPHPAVASSSRAASERRKTDGTDVKGDDTDDDREGIEEWSDYRHQGFYMRVGLGAGLAWVRDPSFFGPGNRSADLIGDFEFSIGGTLGPVAFGYRGLVLPDVTVFSGGFVDVYPDVLEGLHVEASAGASGIFVDDFGATLGVGHDFFFAPEWSVGVTVRGLRSFGSIPVTTASLSVSILCH